ncbi:MAG: hypothetical protein KDE27_16075 [Planctomycetes bacterium]|nr:hypothetical protein [Planctomycetota bacterium]
MRARHAVLLALAAGCAAPRWQDDVIVALQQARRGGDDLVVFFALDGRDASDRMKARLSEPTVLDALARGGFAAVVADGFARKNLYGEWIGGGEGMGVAVLDGGGEVYAARPGPQDPPELAAFLDLCRDARPELAAARAAVAAPGATAADRLRLGTILLRLGCRVKCEDPLLAAAFAGLDDARHRLARLYALDGNVAAARRWLLHVRPTAASRVTEGYVLYKERRYVESAQLLAAAVRQGDLGEDRQLALLYLGKALHYADRDAEAVPLLTALAAEREGSTFEAAAQHMLAHIDDPQHGHSH